MFVSRRKEIQTLPWTRGVGRTAKPRAPKYLFDGSQTSRDLSPPASGAQVPDGVNVSETSLPSYPRRLPKSPNTQFSKFVAIPPRNPDGNIHMGDTRRQGVGNFDNSALVPSFIPYKRLNLRQLIELARHLQGDGCSTNTENNERWTC